MTARIISGKEVAGIIREEIRAEAAVLKTRTASPRAS